MDAKQGISSKPKKKAEKVSPEEKKRRAALARWTKKLGPKGGAGPGFKIDNRLKFVNDTEFDKEKLILNACAGHFDGDEGWPGKGGDRDEMNRTDLKRVLRLLHYGATEVNFKVNYFIFILVQINNLIKF